MAKRKNSKPSSSKIKVESFVHEDAKRRNIPTAEYQSIMQKVDKTPIQVAFERRNKDLDPQLVWRGKDQQNWSDLVVSAPPLYIQEKVHPKVLIDDLLKSSKKKESEEEQINLFADFNGLPNEGAKTEFYQHDSHWSNRMILGDSLQVMASLAEREGLRGKIQCIYFDPPYGIKFNSNFQWSTTTQSVKDGDIFNITREPEQVKAFRDTWRDGIHSYLNYLRDRLLVAKDLLSPSGSIFVQIGEENVHRVRSVLDEVFGDENFISMISFVKTGGLTQDFIKNKCDYILWFAKDRPAAKIRSLYSDKIAGGEGASKYTGVEYKNGVRTTVAKAEVEHDGKLPEGSRTFRLDKTTSESNPIVKVSLKMGVYDGRWKTTEKGMQTLEKAGRISASTNILNYVRYIEDFPLQALSNVWDDIGGIQSRTDPKIYVVQTATEAVKRCILLTTDPGDLVLDPTCGSGTTAMVSEQWGRRWLVIDTSRVALALARGRIMGARYPFYYLADSREGVLKEAEITKSALKTKDVFNKIKLGFVYERAPHITLGSIANNSEIDVIWEKWESKITETLASLNKSLKTKWLEKDVPREASKDWSESAVDLHRQWWKIWEARRSEINSSISLNASSELLFDRPYIDKGKIRVAGPFTVESVSPHRVLGVDSDDSLINESEHLPKEAAGTKNFVNVIIEHLRTAGVQQAHKDERINFTTITSWPGLMICAEASYVESKSKKEIRAAIFIGPEFGTVSRVDLVEAAKEAGDSDFDVLIACAFNFDARAAEFATLGKVPVLKARMNADLHMADDLKNTGKGNLFVIFGEPDIELIDVKKTNMRVKINGVDVFNPNTGEVKSDGAEGIACWLLDTDYDEESFFVRHAYFLGSGDPYKALKTSLKAEIDKEAWESLNSDTSRPFEKPKSGRIAVKVINHLGDEVMKVFKVN